MKTQPFRVQYILLIVVTMMAWTMISCVDDLNSEESRYEEYSRPEDRFDFRTSEYVPVSITASGTSYVLLYERDPRLFPQAMPFFSTIIDSKGQFSDKVDVPQHLIGEQIFVKVNGEVSTATLGTSGIKISDASRAGSRSSAGLSYADVEYDTNRLIKQYFDRLMIKGKNNTDLIDTSAAGVDITTTDDNTEVLFSLVNLTGRFMMQLYYYYYPAERTVPGQSNFEDEKKMAEFIKRFMRSEFCISRNWQNKYTGYNNLDAAVGSQNYLSPDDTGVYIGPDATGWINRNFAQYLNQPATTVKLNYYGWFDSQGRFENIDSPSTGFPANYKIGFFMYVAVPRSDESVDYNGWIKPTDPTNCNESYYQDINKTGKHYIISTDRIINYEIIPKIENGQIVAEPYHHHDRMCATRLLSYNTKGFPCIVYGMEDDLTGLVTNPNAYDFNDIFFAVQTNPLVDTSDIPVIGEGYYAYEGTLLYEDLYPSTGDFDMNDVIVEYQYKLRYEHVDDGNEVTGIDFEFIPIWNGATYRSDFYLNIRQDGVADQPFKICDNVNQVAQANAARIPQNIAQKRNITDGLIKFNGSIYTDQSDHQTYLEVNGQRHSVDMSQVFGQLVRNLDIRNKVFDAFIFVTNNAHEVHMPGNMAVLPGSKRYDDDDLLKLYHVSAKDVYYNKGLEIPFAANIALHSFLTEPGFRQCYETCPISSCYAAFMSWATSKGALNKNWYMRYNYNGPDK